MSERGSFITEYIYCDRCFQAAKSILLDHEKYMCSIVLPSWQEGKFLPIICGKIGGLYAGEELHSFKFEFNPLLEKLICHDMRIAVLAERGQEIFTVKPKK